jgi:hypothetical protein
MASISESSTIEAPVGGGAKGPSGAISGHPRPYGMEARQKRKRALSFFPSYYWNY